MELEKIRVQRNCKQKTTRSIIDTFLAILITPPINAPIDHIFTVTRDNLLFGELDVIRQYRSKRDACKFCRFHKDIGHDTSGAIR